MLRILTDEDFHGPLTRGLLSRVAGLDLLRVQNVGFSGVGDAGVLAHAAADNRIVLTHDVNTMTAAAIARVQAGEPMPGLFIVLQSVPIGRAIEELELRILATEMAEWRDRLEYIT
jgi:predicted nuclease of predicted toxin-antitoxin system